MATESTTAISRRPHRRYPKTQDSAAPKRQKRIREYLEADEVNAIIRAASWVNPKAKLLMLEQWRAGLRVSEALDLEVRALSSIRPPRRCVCVPKAHGGIHSRTQRTTGQAYGTRRRGHHRQSRSRGGEREGSRRCRRSHRARPRRNRQYLPAGH